MEKDRDNKPTDPATFLRWRFPFDLPCIKEGNKTTFTEELVVPALTKQASEHPPGTPLYLEARFQLLRALSFWGRVDEALALVEELQAAGIPKERLCEALMLVGTGAERRNQFDVAVQVYRKVIEADPEEPSERYYSRNNLSYSLNQLGKFDEGAAFARKAIEIEGRQYNAHKNLAVALEGLGLFEEAAESYLRSTYLSPTDRRAYNALVSLAEKHPELLDKLDYLRHEIEFCKSIIRVAKTERHWTTVPLGPLNRSIYVSKMPPGLSKPTVH